MIRHHAVQLAKDDVVRYMVECFLSVEATGSSVVVLAYSLQAYVKKAKFWVDSWQPCLKTPKKITD